ncbi:MAG: hypothetical protein QF464_18070, partial [Myxococcota bacterium]|nr:hypothetical protein [Myxococcota bacterium]
LRGVLPRLGKVVSKIDALAPESTMVLRYPRLVLTPAGLNLSHLAPVETAASTVAHVLASRTVGRAEVQISGLPTCVVPGIWRAHLSPHAPDWALPAPCRACDLNQGCATLSPHYRAVVGTAGLRPVTE